MSWISRAAKQADKARRDILSSATGGATDRLGDWIKDNTGIPTSLNEMRDRGLLGPSLAGLGAGVAALVLGKGMPSGGSVANGCGSISNRKGKKGRHYTFCPRITIAAAAQTENTSRGDFMAAANSHEVASDGYMPFDFDVDAAQLVVGVQMAAAATKEDAASIIGSGVLVIKEQGTSEVSRIPLLRLNPIVSYVGLVGATAAHADTTQLRYDPVPFELDLNDGDETHLEVHFSKTFTTVNVVELALVLEGTRSKRD